MKRITLRLPDDIHDKIEELATEESRSLNSEIIQALKYYIAAKQKDTLAQKALNTENE